ncbi:unnamed protein product [Chondrus crispus]|uniref:Uncharacterized protein n=1 Tax=Chondrus crispus TaxID=2769 RepID=R7QKV6_CHOCR|nr:unnamed protein product [Chondrus crispus]CDF38403.1 unnamed protein product [Chondrus crispus]|eukprot:XP_005718296.1 unnamed protein product [Chondrus crispus]
MLRWAGQWVQARGSVVSGADCSRATLNGMMASQCRVEHVLQPSRIKEHTVR